ncbi:MAG: hypothetical protein ABEK12_01490, partial [Candidatus Nanohaloarchaea archaeon]
VNASGDLRTRLIDNSSTYNNTVFLDYQAVDVAPAGTLNVTLLEPPNDTVVKQNDTFTMNASVTCEGGDCGSVTATPRYNATGDAAGTVIPQGSGTPFHTAGSNSETCDTDLTFAETCYANWTVNATGDL